jgi:hypothetical protein
MRNAYLRFGSNRIRTLLFAVMAAAIIVAIAMISLNTTADTADAAQQCGTVTLKPSQNLSKAMNNRGCATFRLKSGGTYHLQKITAHTQTGDKVIGLGNKRVEINADNALVAFDLGKSKKAWFENISVGNTDSNESCENKCGKAFGSQKASNVTLKNVRVHDHPNIGVSIGSNLKVYNFDCQRVGSYNHSIIDMNNPSTDRASAACIKHVGDGLVVRNSSFRQFWWQGVWCDNEGTNVRIINSYFNGGEWNGKRVGKSAIQIENCSHGLVKDNKILNSGWLEAAVPTKRSGVNNQMSAYFTYEGNYIKGNHGKGAFNSTGGRDQPPKGVIWRNNTLPGNDAIDTCRAQGTTCKNNKGNELGH